MANAIKTQGFVFEIGNGDDPLTYTAVEEIMSFNFFDGSANEIDVTHLQSTAKEFLIGLQDFGSGSLEVSHLPGATGQNLMRTAKASGDIQDFQITFSDASTATFQGFVLSNSITGGVDDKVGGTFDIRISGDVVFA